MNPWITGYFPTGSWPTVHDAWAAPVCTPTTAVAGVLGPPGTPKLLLVMTAPPGTIDRCVVHRHNLRGGKGCFDTWNLEKFLYP